MPPHSALIVTITKFRLGASLPSSAIIQGVGEKFGDVDGGGIGHVVNVTAAARAGCDDAGSRLQILNLIREVTACLDGEAVFVRAHAERPGHAATSGVERCNGAVGEESGEPFEQLRIRQRLGVAMAVDGHPVVALRERQGRGLFLKKLEHELFK